MCTRPAITQAGLTGRRIVTSPLRPPLEVGTTSWLCSAILWCAGSLQARYREGQARPRNEFTNPKLLVSNDSSDIRAHSSNDQGITKIRNPIFAGTRFCSKHCSRHWQPARQVHTEVVDTNPAMTHRGGRSLGILCVCPSSVFVASTVLGVAFTRRGLARHGLIRRALAASTTSAHRGGRCHRQHSSTASTRKGGKHQHGKDTPRWVACVCACYAASTHISGWWRVQVRVPPADALDPRVKVQTVPVPRRAENDHFWTLFGTFRKHFSAAARDPTSGISDTTSG